MVLNIKSIDKNLNLLVVYSKTSKSCKDLIFSNQQNVPNLTKIFSNLGKVLLKVQQINFTSNVSLPSRFS